MLFLLIERLDDFNLKLLFLVQMTKKDLTILLKLSYHFFIKKKNAVKISKCYNKIIMKLVMKLKKCIKNVHNQ